MVNADLRMSVQDVSAVEEVAGDLLRRLQICPQRVCHQSKQRRLVVRHRRYKQNHTIKAFLKSLCFDFEFSQYV